MPYETLIVEKRGRVLYVTMNRPESLNASEEAQLGLPEVRRGINPGPGIHHLMRRMPYAITLRYLMTGAHMTAQQALQHGLVNRVVPRDQLDAAVEELVNELLEAAPLAVRAIKETALRGFNVPLSAALSLTGPPWLMDSADSKEGP